MSPAMEEGRSTPRYALLFAGGVAIGSVLRLVGWLVPSALLSRVTDRLLPRD